MKIHCVTITEDGTEIFFIVEPPDEGDSRSKLTYTVIPEGSIRDLGYILFPGEIVCVD